MPTTGCLATCAPEKPLRGSLPDWFAAVIEARAAGADVVAIQTHVTTLAEAERRLAGWQDGRDPAMARFPGCFSWGHPAGLEFGRSAEAEADASHWLALAARLGHDRQPAAGRLLRHGKRGARGRRHA